MKITIATGIYPPEIGGPAEYSRQLFETFSIQGHDANVVTFSGLRWLPTGLRHIAYFFKLCIDSFSSDYIISMDTFSVSFPAVIFSKFFGKRIAVRVAGDFLWESYVQRTNEMTPLTEFYIHDRHYSLKEKIISVITRVIFNLADCIVFSTIWQRDIMSKNYSVKQNKTKIIENYFPGEKVFPDKNYDKKIFLAPSRNINIKNISKIEETFRRMEHKDDNIILDIKTSPREALMEKISKSYAVIVASLSEISPNLVMDAVQYCTPVIVTKYNGITDRISEFAIFIDPLSSTSIMEGINKVLDPYKYSEIREKIKNYNYSHSWNEIAGEFIDVYENIK